MTPSKSSISTHTGAQVEEDSAETGKKGFVDLKQVVWHKAFYKIVESIEQYTELGFVLDCGDGVRQKIYPFILIVSADYEEQYVFVAFIPGPPMILIKYLSLSPTDVPFLLFVESTANFPVQYALFQVINLQTSLTNLH